MLSQTATDSHKIKWMKAERELAVRGVLLPHQTLIHECFLTPSDRYVPLIDEEVGPQKAFPTKRP